MDINKKQELINNLSNLYSQYRFIKNDAAGKKSLQAIIKGKEDSFIELVKNERNTY